MGQKTTRELLTLCSENAGLHNMLPELVKVVDFLRSGGKRATLTVCTEWHQDPNESSAVTMREQIAGTIQGYLDSVSIGEHAEFKIVSRWFFSAPYTGESGVSFVITRAGD